MSQFTFSKTPFFVTMPHSGEKYPESCGWLNHLPEEILMCDVDRYVDRLYEPSIAELKIKSVKTDWHRYAVDLNRIPTDIDASSVEGNVNKAGTYSRGYHWVITTKGYQLMPKPISQKLHEELTQLIYDPFHRDIQKIYEEYKAEGHKNIFHLDAHSMPSLGTAQHRDPGERRADIVVSDFLGKSCHKNYRDLVIAAYVAAGFKVGYNWPYIGGRVTEQYGTPQNGQQAIQVELNRDLYMDEVSKQIKSTHQEIQNKIAKALSYIQSEVPNLKI